MPPARTALASRLPPPSRRLLPSRRRPVPSRSFTVPLRTGELAEPAEGLEIELDGRARVLKVVLVLRQHERMHRAEGAKHNLLDLVALGLLRRRAGSRRDRPHQHDLGPPTLVVGLVIGRLDFVVCCRVTLLALRFDQIELHHPVHQAVDHLEAVRQTGVRRRQMPLVASTDVGVGVLKDHVADLVELDTVFHRHRFVVLEGLEQAWQQRRAHHLVLLVRRVRQLHRRAVVNSPKVVEVLARHTQAVSEDLGEPRTRDLVPQLVAEVVERQRPADRLRGWHLARDELVEAVRNGHILDDVHRVKNI
mmetsp:Transcript_66198/g.182702  ORF Transcript_66198/g.182702 Transcript_66198/m.182702 type:complete len:306 (+) Transcript_66198:73-990(+)